MKKLFSLLCVVLLLLSVTGLAACGKKKAVVVKKKPKPVKVAPAPKPTWPLTGLTTTDATAAARFPLSVKIENSTVARPQSGINSADIVYETMVEGGITRFNCLFASQIPDEVGPVRSARLSDIWVVPQYQGLLFYSGANDQVIGALDAAGLNKTGVDSVSGLYHRVDDREAPHNLFLSLSQAYAEVQKAGVAITGSGVRPGPVFGALTSTETTASGLAIDIPFSPVASSSWIWDSGAKCYLRSTDGEVHVDAKDGKQLWATNVVVMWAPYTQASALDPAGNPTFDTTLGGSGKAAIFRGGLRIDGTWTAAKDTPPTFTDVAGTPIPLEPGRTFFEVPQDSVVITSK
jgi:hypothetical protein